LVQENQKRKMISKDFELIMFITIFLSVTLIVGFSISMSIKEKIKKDYACYTFHVQECLDCHKENLTYLLCSGFCVKPSLQDFDKKGCPVVNPLNNCSDLPQECNL
jgi:hypothetical protein